jgi:hypothetical protein
VQNPRINLEVVVYPRTGDNAKTRLPSAKVATNNFPPAPGESEKVYLRLAKIANTIQRLGLKADLQPQAKNAVMGDFDIFMKNLFVNKINQRSLPFADENTFNETIGQQFKYLEEGYEALNDKMFNDLLAIVDEKNQLEDDDTKVNTRDIAKRINQITLGDLTLNLTEIIKEQK